MIQKQQNSCDVLIVGAGPAGLMMACQLALHGIKFRIIDKRSRMTNYSGAYLIQARTLEIWEQMGFANKALLKGKIAKKIVLISKGRQRMRLPIAAMGNGFSKFPFILMLKQFYTEQFFTHYLDGFGISIERNVELVSLKSLADGSSVELMGSDGASQLLNVNYVIGADGANSTVRSQLAIPWTGKQSDVPLFVTDCPVLSNQDSGKKYGSTVLSRPENSIVFSLSKERIGGFFPLTGSTWRIDGLIPEDVSGDDERDFERVVGAFPKSVNLDIALEKPLWFSAFRPQTFIADGFNKARCFLIGDAAHVHTPIGAQGMNTGIQDAFNLAWKLAFVIKGHAGPHLLESYNTERRPIAEKLIATTDRYFHWVIKKGWWATLFRNQLFPWFIMVFSPFLRNIRLQRNFFKAISQTGLMYQAGSLSSEALSSKFDGPQPGERWPYIRWIDETGKISDIQTRLSLRHFTLFVFYRDEDDKFAALKSYLKTALCDVAEPVFIAFSESTKGLFKKLGLIHTSGYYLVRPDGYVALKNNSLKTNVLELFFDDLKKQ